MLFQHGRGASNPAAARLSRSSADEIPLVTVLLALPLVTVLLKVSFEEQQETALQDYVEAQIMLQYNKR